MTRLVKDRLIASVCMFIAVIRAQAQNRGVYPLGMSAINSGLTPAAGFTYSNQLLYYARGEAKDNAGNTVATGSNAVVMDMNTITWAGEGAVLFGARYSSAVTLPFARNSLTSDIHGDFSGGGGFADSYYMPFILGWKSERTAVRFIYGFLAPTGRFGAVATNNVGSGYWTHALSSGQTFYLIQSGLLTFSTFEMYEFHTTQQGTRTHPGQTFDLDYSLLTSLKSTQKWQFQIGLAGYIQRQTTATTGPDINPVALDDRYAVNSLGVAMNAAFPKRKASLQFKIFKEFENRSTFQGYSVQFGFAISL
jgi:hypothetical protein